MSSSSSLAMALPSLASLGHTVTEKLTRDNFLVCKTQVLPHIRAAGMTGYLDGSVKEPAAFLESEKEISGKKVVEKVPNPEYAIWVTQDQQVLTFLLATMRREVLLQVNNLVTASSVWAAVLQSFSSQSRAKISQLRSQIGCTRKGDLSAAAYFTKMKTIADEMAAAGKPLDEDEVVSHILEGLDADYNPFVSAISMRVDQGVGLNELYSLLLSAEARIEAQNSYNSSANLASNGGNRGGYGRPSGGNTGGGGNSNNSGGGGPRSNSNNTPGARQGGGGGDMIKCQLCKLEGHGAWRCKKRYDRNYNNNFQRQGGGGGQGGRGGGDRAANAATNSYGVDTNWYLDTGATDHLTGDVERLAVRDRYTGNEQIHTASGQGSGNKEGSPSRQE